MAFIEKAQWSVALAAFSLACSERPPPRAANDPLPAPLTQQVSFEQVTPTVTAPEASTAARAQPSTAAPGQPSTAPHPLGVSGSWTLAFSEEFGGKVLDVKRWRILGKGDRVDWGTQTWSADHSYLDGAGNLVTRLTSDGRAATGGAIYSKWPLGRGYYEARIKHEGGWFAWWIASHQMGNGGANEDPATYGTEMDLCEAKPWSGDVLEKQHAVHWKGYGEFHRVAEASTGIQDTEWHVYGFMWSSAAYDFYVDGKRTYHFDGAISRTSDQYMIINNASYQGAQTPGTAYVDYVRYWKPQNPT